MKHAMNAKKTRTYVPVIDLQCLLQVKNFFFNEEKNVEPKEVKQEKVAHTMFSVDTPISPGMELDHFWPNGTSYYVLDHITPGPTVPSKIHLARARKKAEELTEPISKKKKRRCNKKMDNLVPISLEKTTQAMPGYELNTLRQIAIAESLSKISVGNDG